MTTAFADGFTLIKYVHIIIIIIIININIIIIIIIIITSETGNRLTIYNYLSHKEVDIRQRNKTMAENGNF